MAHAFWLVKDNNSDKWYEVTGGPDPKTGKVIGYVNDALPKDKAIEHALCGVPKKDLQLLGSTKVDSQFGTFAGLNAARDQFNSTVGTRNYFWQGSNSNTYANVFGQGMGIRMPANTQTVYYNLCGWNWKPRAEVDYENA